MARCLSIVWGGDKMTIEVDFIASILLGIICIGLFSLGYFIGVAKWKFKFDKAVYLARASILLADELRKKRG